jgi:hypothetical protein
MENSLLPPANNIWGPPAQCCGVPDLRQGTFAIEKYSRDVVDGKRMNGVKLFKDISFPIGIIGKRIRGLSDVFVCSG